MERVIQGLKMVSAEETLCPIIERAWRDECRERDTLRGWNEVMFDFIA